MIERPKVRLVASRKSLVGQQGSGKINNLMLYLLVIASFLSIPRALFLIRVTIEFSLKIIVISSKLVQINMLLLLLLLSDWDLTA